MGRLTRDPEERALPSGKSVSNFGIATNRYWNNRDSGEKQKQTEFHNVVAFGNLADICNQYLSKGQMVLIEGRIQTRSWEDKENNKRSKTEIIAENMQMGPRTGGETPSGPQAPGKGSKQGKEEKNLPVEDIDEQPKKQDKNSGDNNSEEDDQSINVKDIPF